MNYIAHLHLAKVTNTSYAGNLLGDFQWQPDPQQMALFQGWKLHQAVDTYVDAHPASEHFKTLPRAGRRRFAGIVQDIVMDYWLIRSWSEFEHSPFEDFAEQAVVELTQDKAQCPPRLLRMIESLEQHNWLPELGTLYGIERAILSIQRRWQHGEYLTPFLDALPETIEQAHEPFFQLYPDVLNEAQRLIKSGL